MINKNKNYDLTEQEIQKGYETTPDWASDNDLLWEIFNEKNANLIISKSWGLYRNNLYHMSQFLYEEKKYEQSLVFLISVFCIDISGMENGNFVNSLDSILIAPGLISEIKRLLTICDINSNYINQLFIEAQIYCRVLPFNYYSTETAYKILTDCLEEKVFDYKKYPSNKPVQNSKYYDYYNFESYRFNHDNISKEVKHTQSKYHTNHTNKISYLKILLLIIFFPIGVCYIIYWLMKKIFK